MKYIEKLLYLYLFKTFRKTLRSIYLPKFTLLSLTNHSLTPQAKLSLIIISLALLLFSASSSFILNIYAQKGGNATGGDANGLSAIGGSAAGGNAIGEEAIGGNAIGGNAIGGNAMANGGTNSTSNSSSNMPVVSSPFH